MSRRWRSRATHKPHVALVDLFLAEESGAELTGAIREASPATRVLLISGAGRMSPAAARAAGASGFVSKDWDASRVAAAVRRVGLGMTSFPPKAEQPAPLLTEREREVLDLIAVGSTNREIAEQLYLSPHTVKEHTSALYRKLRARNRAEAVQSAQRIGLLARDLGPPAAASMGASPRPEGDRARPARTPGGTAPRTSSEARPTPGNGSLATPRAPNARSPGSGTESGAFALASGASVPLSGLLLAAGAHEPLERRQLERVRDVAAGEHADADRQTGDHHALAVVEARRRPRAPRARRRSACPAPPARTTCRWSSPSRRSARSRSRPAPGRAR